MGLPGSTNEAGHRARRDDRVMAAGLTFGTVLADTGYGMSAPFRQGLSTRGLTWAVGIPGRQKVYPAQVVLTWPNAGRGRPRKNPLPQPLSRSAEAMLAETSWTELSWRIGTKGPLEASFAALRVRIADGAPQRILDKGQQHLPGEEAWLVGEHRVSGERKYYLSNLPANADLATLAATIKARWVCEQAHQQMKEEIGLDHFEPQDRPPLHVAAAAFIAPDHGSVLLQSLLLGSTQIAISLSVNALITVSVGSIASFLARRPCWSTFQRWVMAGVLGGLAIRMATEARR